MRIETIRDDRASGGRRVRVVRGLLAHDQELQDRIALIRQGFSHAEARKLAKVKAAARQARAQASEGE